MNRATLLILNGPGPASPDGNAALQEIREDCSALCDELGIDLEFRQTDDESEAVRWLTQGNAFDALIINPGTPKRLAATLMNSGRCWRRSKNPL